MCGARVWGMRCVLLAMTALAYGPLWNNDFIDFDDEVLITNNPHVIEGLSLSGISWAWTNHEAPYWMPLAWISFQLDACFPSEAKSQIAGQSSLSPAVFHGHNLFWHACNVQLLFALFCRLTALRWRSFLIAALFAIHPMHVESVAWAIERKDVLMCFFGLVSIWAYVRYVKKPGWVPYLVMLLAYLASLMCKPMLVTLPFVLLLLDYWPLCRLQLRSAPIHPKIEVERRHAPMRTLLLEKLPLFIVVLVTTVETMDSRSIIPMVEVTVFSRLMNAFSGYEFYLSKTFYPVRLAIFYPHSGNNWSLLHSLVGAGLLFFCTAISLWQAKRWHWLPVGWLWFAGTLVPVIGLTQGGQQAWADRFCYWPHIGLFLSIVWGTSELANRLRIPSWVIGGLWTLILATLMVLTWLQVGHWRTSIAIWEHAVAVTEDNDFAHQHLSINYRRECRVGEADFHLQESSRIQSEKMRRSLH
jgi:protein O-mannosyl-transferase